MPVLYCFLPFLRLLSAPFRVSASRVFPCPEFAKSLEKPIVGNTVSHANNKRRRRFLPNLHTHRFWLESEKRFVSLRVSANGMRIIDKKGLEAVVAEMRSRGEKV